MAEPREPHRTRRARGPRTASAVARMCGEFDRYSSRMCELVEDHEGAHRAGTQRWSPREILCEERTFAWVARPLDGKVATYRVALDAIRWGDPAELRLVELPPTRRLDGGLRYRPAIVKEWAHYDARAALAELAARAAVEVGIEANAPGPVETLQNVCLAEGGAERYGARWKWWSEELEELVATESWRAHQAET